MHRFGHLPLPLLLALACTPRSVDLGDEDGDSTADPGASEGDDDDTDEPTGGAPSDGLQIHAGVRAVDLEIGPDGSAVALGQRGYNGELDGTFQSGNGPMFDSDWIARLDPAGQPLWVKELPTVNDATPNALAIGPAGDLYILRYGNTGDTLQKLDPTGQPLWKHKLAGVGHRDVAASADGRVLVLSESQSLPFVQSFDPDGELQWEQTYDHPGNHGSGYEGTEGDRLAVDDGDGALLVTGNVYMPDYQGQGWLLRAKLGTGEALWQRFTTAEGSPDGRTFDIGVAADGTALVVVGDPGTILKAYSRAGDELWTFEPADGQPAGRLSVAPDGSFAQTGGRYHYTDDNEQCPDFGCPLELQIARYAADRTLLWSDTDEQCKEGSHVGIIPGGVVVFGQCSRVPYGDYSVALMHYPH